MSHRPILGKKVNKLRKAMRRQLPARIDLVAYLKDRRLADTTGQAEAIILAKRVKAESHILGVKKETRLAPLTLVQTLAGQTPKVEEVEVVERYVDAAHRPNIVVLPA